MENEKKAWQTPELQEMAVVVLSLHQKWWQKMAAGEKVLELRKSKPQCKAPFRVLVYVTGGVGVVGEFVCPEVLEIKNFEEAETGGVRSGWKSRISEQSGKIRNNCAEGIPPEAAVQRLQKRRQGCCWAKKN